MADKSPHHRIKTVVGVHHTLGFSGCARGEADMTDCRRIHLGGVEGRIHGNEVLKARPARVSRKLPVRFKDHNMADRPRVFHDLRSKLLEGRAAMTPGHDQDLSPNVVDYVGHLPEPVTHWNPRIDGAEALDCKDGGPEFVAVGQHHRNIASWLDTTHGETGGDPAREVIVLLVIEAPSFS